MTSREEILVRLGLDGNALTDGMNHMGDKVKEFASSVATRFAGMFAAEKILESFNEVRAEVKRLKADAEGLGITTGFLQDIQNVASTVGLSAESVDKLLGKFLKGLPQGSDLQEELLKIADRMKDISDPAERARLAITEFGRGGIQMIPILMKGSDGIEELAAKFQKLSEAEIYQIEQMNLMIERTENWFKTTLAKGVGFMKFWRDLPYTIGASAAAIAQLMSLSNPGAMLDLIKLYETKSKLEAQSENAAHKKEAEENKEAAAIERQRVHMNDIADAKEKYEQKAKEHAFQRMTAEEQIASLSEDIEKKKAKAAEDEAKDGEKNYELLGLISDEEEKRAEIIDRQVKLAERLNKELRDQGTNLDNINQRERDKNKPTIGDLGKNNNSPFQNIANQISQNQKDAKDAYAMGDKARGDALSDEITGYDYFQPNVEDFKNPYNGDVLTRPKRGHKEKRHVKGLREMLEDSGAITPDEHIKAIRTKIDEIYETATKAGLVIKDTE